MLEAQCYAFNGGPRIKGHHFDPSFARHFNGITRQSAQFAFLSTFGYVGATYGAVVLVSGALTFIIWLAIGKDLAFAMERMVTVIVICCPHALGLAVPLVVARSTAISAQSGLLIKDRTAFENSRKISTLVFDKTGTLTRGEFNVVRFESSDDTYSKEEILNLASSLEGNSEHPIATGIVRKSRDLNQNRIRYSRNGWIHC